MHYYLQKGIAPDTTLSLSPIEQVFWTASMKLAIEEQAEMMKKMMNG